MRKCKVGSLISGSIYKGIGVELRSLFLGLVFALGAFGIKSGAGLAIGMTCYFFYTIKRRWVEQDIKDMALITELLLENHKKGRTNHEISEKD